MKCLDNIVGVTPEVCECLTNEITPEQITALSVSTSGLYLNDLPGGITLDALAKVDVCKNFAVMALDAIASAQKRVEADLIVAINENYTKGLKNFMGTIGQLSYTGSQTCQKRYQAFLLRAKDGTDAIIKITRIGLIVNGSEATNVQIVSAPRFTSVGTVIATYPITTTANNFSFVVPPGGSITLPLSQAGQPLDYYFVFDSTVGAGLSPKDNKALCNCPGVDKSLLVQYVTPSGIQFDDLNSLSFGINDKTTRGFVVDCEMKCNSEQLVCGNYDNDEAIAVVLAWASLFKAGEMLIENVMQTRELNRYTLQNKEYLWGKRSNFISEYNTRIVYAAKVIDITSSTCYICRDNDMYYTKNIGTDGGYQNVYDTVRDMQLADYMGFNPNTETQVIPGVIKLPSNY